MRAQSLPFAAVTGQEVAKLALMLVAVDPALKGLSIAGRRGTGKTVLARGLQYLLPAIEQLEGCLCHCDPEQSRCWCSDCRQNFADEDNLPVRRMKAPFMELPLGTTEDRLLGAIDVEKALGAGGRSWQPGLLGEANRGVLYIDQLNLLDDSLVNSLFDVMSGVTRLEREGISVQYPSDFILVGTYDPEEGPLRAHLADRFAIHVSSVAILDLEKRIEILRRQELFHEDQEAFVELYREDQEEVLKNIEKARKLLSDVKITEEQTLYLVGQALKRQVPGHRADLFAVRLAKAHAALQGRKTVEPIDLAIALELVIKPRQLIDLPENEEMEPPPPPPPPPPPEPEENQQDETPPDSPQNNEETMMLPEEFFFDSEEVPVDDELLALQNKVQKQARGGAHGKQKSLERGRYTRALLPPPGKPTKVAVDATLRAAAPFQAQRRQSGKYGDRQVIVTESDLRTKQFVRKSGALIVFVVDASGSMAFNRIRSAKGAVATLLNEAYVNRDKVAMVIFRGQEADVIVPPTRSVELAKKRFDQVPVGGASPLASAIAQALELGVKAIGGDVGQVIITLLTDGRGNIPLNLQEGKKMNREQLNEEVLALSRMVADNGFSMLVIDSSNRFTSTGFAQKIADAARGQYYYLPKMSAEALAETVKSGVHALRK
ncbi:magnesium chelatase ATPase subunit D [Heliorestis acidaminivorans]|uniref:Mg-protoporphyrin IX chelatase n=1 Tax=Heliorestis acidaminivorans TaxID=553427 RepID=A0A6I0F1K0_9FIRM|nr:magnesium chelatase ATPase subunit D [Heliorestis acidaminivorans]KAB2953067.1 magnesium chelatase ATPase subunit D [Heliorestis acidaminivorans]